MIDQKTKLWIITFNFGEVKAGPVLRFLKYTPYFEKQQIEVTFITKDRGEVPSKTSDKEPNVIYIKCENLIELTKLAIDRATKEEIKPNCLLFLAIDHQSYFSILKAKLNGIKLLYVSTMQFSLKFKEFGTPRSLLARISLFFLLNRTFSLFNYIICSTNLLKEDFKKLKVANNKLQVIYNGVDTQKFKPTTTNEKQQLREKHHLPKDKFIVLFVGLFVERKGVDYLVNLFKNYAVEKGLLNTPYLLMVGNEMLDITENSDSFKNNWPVLKQSAIESGMVRFDLFSSEIQEYYGAADLFIFPSKLEGMPNVLLESMSVGLPILINKFDGFSDDYGNEKQEYDLLTYKFDTDIKTLEFYVNNLAELEKLGNNARMHAINYFNFETSINAFVSLIK
jgi:glycosyltransferase involved in cell wall biosynthesis